MSSSTGSEPWTTSRPDGVARKTASSTRLAIAARPIACTAPSGVRRPSSVAVVDCRVTSCSSAPSTLAKVKINAQTAWNCRFSDGVSHRATTTRSSSPRPLAEKNETESRPSW